MKHNYSREMKQPIASWVAEVETPRTVDRGGYFKLKILWIFTTVTFPLVKSKIYRYH